MNLFCLVKCIKLKYVVLFVQSNILAPKNKKKILDKFFVKKIEAICRYLFD